MWLSEKPEVQVLPGLPKIHGRELRQGGKSGGLRALPKFCPAVCRPWRGCVYCSPPRLRRGCRRHGLSDAPSEGVLTERVASASRRFQVLSISSGEGERVIGLGPKARDLESRPPFHLAVVGAAECPAISPGGRSYHRGSFGLTGSGVESRRTDAVSFKFFQSCCRGSTSTKQGEVVSQLFASSMKPMRSRRAFYVQ